MTDEHGPLPVGVVELDGDDRVVAANAVFRAWYGEGDVVGRALDEVLVPAPGDLVPAFELGPRMLLHPDGSDRALLADRTATATGALLTTMDATERYRALSRLRDQYVLADRTRTRLELVIAASIEFASATTEGRLAEILVETLAKAYRAEQAAVFLRDPRGALHRAAGENPFPGVDDATISRLSLGLNRVVTVSGVDEAGRVAPMVADAMRAVGVHAILAVPIRHERERYGIAVVFFHHPRSFDQEAAPLADALTGQAGQVFATLALQRRLEHAAMHDETTGLPNRRLLEEQLREHPRGGSRYRAVVFLDLDDFKSINDELGHAVGDEVLGEVGRRLRAATRETDIVARYGGDEFVAVCDIDSPELAGEIAARLGDALAEPLELADGSRAVGASIGVTVADIDDRRTLDRLIRDADQAMYVAKRDGGGRVHAG